MSHFSITALQLSLPAGDNLQFIGKEIEKAKRRFPWIDMVVASELCSYGPNKDYTEQMPGKAELFYCNLARELNIWIIPGSHYEQIGNEIYNTTSIISNNGEIVDRYRKIYPFCPYESGISSGKNFVVFDVPQGRIGIAICYDLWFPEVARTLTCMGAEAIIYPTLTGTIDRPVELLIAQSTAVINQCYTMSVNASGVYGNGQSIIVGPEGDVIYQAGQEGEIIPIEIDFKRVRRTRERGINGLGQPLKSFRDNEIEFEIYQNKNKKNQQLEQLGTLKVPQQNLK